VPPRELFEKRKKGKKDLAELPGELCPSGFPLLLPITTPLVEEGGGKKGESRISPAKLWA